MALYKFSSRFTDFIYEKAESNSNLNVKSLLEQLAQALVKSNNNKYVGFHTEKDYTDEKFLKEYPAHLDSKDGHFSNEALKSAYRILGELFTGKKLEALVKEFLEIEKDNLVPKPAPRTHARKAPAPPKDLDDIEIEVPIRETNYEDVHLTGIQRNLDREFLRSDRATDRAKRERRIRAADILARVGILEKVYSFQERLDRLESRASSWHKLFALADHHDVDSLKKDINVLVKQVKNLDRKLSKGLISSNDHELSVETMLQKLQYLFMKLDRMEQDPIPVYELDDIKVAVDKMKRMLKTAM